MFWATICDIDSPRTAQSYRPGQALVLGLGFLSHTRGGLFAINPGLFFALILNTKIIYEFKYPIQDLPIWMRTPDLFEIKIFANFCLEAV